MRWGRGTYQNRKEALIRQEKEARLIIKGEPHRHEQVQLSEVKKALIIGGRVHLYNAERVLLGVLENVWGHGAPCNPRRRALPMAIFSAFSREKKRSRTLRHTKRTGILSHYRNQLMYMCKSQVSFVFQCTPS